VAVNIVKLRKQARDLGVRQSIIDGGTRQELEKAIKAKSKSNGTAPVVKKKRKATSTAAVKKATTRKSTRKKAATAPAKPKGNAKVGRALIGSLDYTDVDGWNPREGSPVDVIWKALKRAKDNVDKAFEILKPKINDLTSPSKPGGGRRTKAEREALLKYRINRTRFEFAVRTGQHKRGTARVEYGTGEYAKATAKAKRSRSRKK
jgi:hypothetical protein